MRAARSLKTFPTLPVLDREDSRSSFAEGQLVKIRNTSEEEAKRVFDASGIHWNSSKAQLLGSVGELRSAAENYYAVYTPDRSDWWRWPLSMLQEVDEDSICTDRVNFQQGHLVKVRKLDLDEVQRLCSVPDTLPWEPNLQDEVEGVTWKPSMAQLLGSVGKVETRRKDSCRVSFGDSLVWWPLTMLEAPLCPQGHLLRLATAEFHICNGCGCGLSDTSAHCGECQQHFCSHCAQEEIGESIEVGARVRFLNNAADVCWNDCPGDSLPFLRGDLCRISELQGAWFRSGHLWAPVAAVEAYSATEDPDDLSQWKGADNTHEVDYGAEEWASTSTDLKDRLRRKTFAVRIVLEQRSSARHDELCHVPRHHEPSSFVSRTMAESVWWCTRPRDLPQGGVVWTGRSSTLRAIHSAKANGCHGGGIDSAEGRDSTTQMGEGRTTKRTGAESHLNSGFVYRIPMDTIWIPLLSSICPSRDLVLQEFEGSNF